MNTSLSIDSSEWGRAVTEYAAATNKTLAEALNRQILNLTFHGHKEVEKAEKETIERLEDPSNWPWWPALVAKILSKKSQAKLMHIVTGKRTRYMEYLQANRMLNRGQRYTREEAREFSRKLIKRRVASIGYLRFFFVSLGNAVKPYINGSKPRAPYGRKMNGFASRISPATPDKLSCDVATWFDYSKRSNKTAKKAERLLSAALDRAIAPTIADMKGETERRMEADARRYSA